jgi:hypothetical protein
MGGHDFELYARPWVKITAVKALTCLFCLLLLKAEAQNVSDLLQQGVSVQHAVVPLYPVGSFKLSAIVRVDRVYMDYQRKGFFRIGLFPIGVLDGVTFEAQDPADPMASLAVVRRWLDTKTGQRIEMRRVKFLFSPTNRLEASVAKCAADDRWDLLKGVRFVSGISEIRASRGTLQVGGPGSGRLTLETTPKSTTTVVVVPLPAASNEP